MPPHPSTEPDAVNPTQELPIAGTGMYAADTSPEATANQLTDTLLRLVAHGVCLQASWR